MRVCSALLDGAGLLLAAFAAAATASAQNSPLSSPSYLGGPPVGGNYSAGSSQPSALWYYGPSYSPYYNAPPSRPYSSSGATDYYRPSSHHDAFYGHPHYGRSYYDHWRPWPYSGLRAYPY